MAIIDTQFVELARVGQLLENSGRYNSIFWFVNQSKIIERDLGICEIENWIYILPSGYLRNTVNVNSTKRQYNTIVPNSLRARSVRIIPPVIRGVLKFLRSLRNTFRIAREIRMVLAQNKPSLVIIAEGMPIELHMLSKICYRKGIPTVIVPFTVTSASEQAVHIINNSNFNASNTLVKRLISALFPRWVFTCRGQKLLLLPIWDILALEFSGFAPSNPWITSDEDTSIIAVENEAMYRHYRDDNIPTKRMIITGALTDDVLAKSLKEVEASRGSLCQELDLPANRPLLLCALPPSQFPRKCEFENYEDLIRFWMETLATLSGWNVVVRPHPRLTNKEIESLKGFGVGITQRDTASLVPLCDLYVASVSATIRWAIACGKPVVNYDVYRLGYNDYEEAKGVITITDQASFVSTLRRMITEPDYYAKVTAFQRECMTQWGKLDGKSGERMLQLFDDVKNTQYTHGRK